MWDKNSRLAVRSALLVMLVPLALTGCVGALFRQPVNVEVTRQEVETLRKQQAEVLALLRDLRSQMEEQSGAVAALRADTNSQLRDLEERLQVLQSQLEEQGMVVERLQRRPAPPPPVQVDTAAVAASTALGDTVNAARRRPEPEEPIPPAGEGELYDAAYRDYSRGNYQLAISGFQEFLRYYPQSDRADNAQYWIGECRFALGDLDEAVQEFLKVRDMYPDGNKVAAATLKIGYAFLRKGDQATARRYFETVKREFPGSDEARLAEDKLESLR